MEKLRRLLVLARRGATKGEREAARLAAQRLAKKLGVAIEETVKQTVTPPAQPWSIADGAIAIFTGFMLACSVAWLVQ